MLVLTREKDEEIELEIKAGFSGTIRIAYLGQLHRNIGAKTISEGRIGISAPREVNIIRSELRRNDG